MPLRGFSLGQVPRPPHLAEALQVETNQGVAEPLAPLLGGSTFSFGLILAVALLGIGSGGLAYSLLFGRRRSASVECR